MEHVIPARPDAEKKSLRAAEQARADIAEARRVWRELQPGLQPEKLVFLDESWAKTNMTRLYGRSPRGTRLVGTVPFGHWNTTTFVAGLRHDRLVAPMVLNGAMNGRAFRAWVEQCLAPTLDHGDTVIADNLGSHKVGGVRDAIEARGARLLFLPAYSPDLSDIPPDSWPLLENLDLWIVDGLRYAPHPSHFSVADALSWVDRFKPRRAVITNMHSDLDYEVLRQSLPAGVIPAHDGMRLDLR